MFILLLLLNLLFYWVVKILLQKAEADELLRLLEVQDKQYESLSRYLEQEAKARHDFRQTIYTLAMLSDEKDYQTLDEYLRLYKENLPQRNIVSFCPHHALNALLNHYAKEAASHSIPLDIKIQLPKDLPIGSTDLCSIIGNILENAVRACCDVPEDKRCIRLIASLENPQEIYITIVNSYVGHLRKIDNRYFSTHKDGSGIGLLSIEATAARYNGADTFSHDESMFYSDVILKTTVASAKEYLIH
ncbi:MAG: sensor histidine kinase [Lachnospiraceae bacterium]|nr:sensor histidine kinase [Lachnospiraceae bacterium]